MSEQMAAKMMVEPAKDIVFLVASMTHTRPKHIIPLPKQNLHKSALGKLPKAKLKSAFEESKYEQYEDSKDLAVRQVKAESLASYTEYVLMSVLQDLFDIPEV